MAIASSLLLCLGSMNLLRVQGESRDFTEALNQAGAF